MEHEHEQDKRDRRASERRTSDFFRDFDKHYAETARRIDRVIREQREGRLGAPAGEGGGNGR